MSQSDPFLIRTFKAAKRLIDSLNQKPVWHNLFKFIRLSGRKLWTIFRVLFLNHYIRGIVVILRTVWLTVVILFIGFAFLKFMDQARDVLEAMVEPSTISTLRTSCAFLAVFLCSLATWYFTRLVFVLKSQQRYVELELIKIDADESTKELSEQQANAPNIPDGRGIGELTTEPKPGAEPASLKEKTQVIRTTERESKTGDEGMAIDDDDRFKLDDNWLKTLARWTPLTLGAMPILTFILALKEIPHTTWQMPVLILLYIPYVLIAYFSKNYVKEKSRNTESENSSEPQSDDRDIQGHRFSELLPVHVNTIILAFLLSIGWFILSTLQVTNIPISRFIGPVSIVFLGLSVLVFVASVLIYLDYLFNTPLTLIVLIVAAFLHNNNHQIRTIDHRNYYSKDRYDSLKITEHFKRWLTYRIDSTAVKDTAYHDSTKRTYPVYLVAAEGGGVRAAHWTASVLAKLEEMHPGFFRHVFAISGASGGSVGASMFTALYRDNQAFSRQVGNASGNGSLLEQTQGILKNDFLSPLVAAFFGPDLVQKFLPVSINNFDRAQYLEDSFSNSYYQNWNPAKSPIHVNTLDSAFTDLWTGTNAYELPALFLNTTRVETGQKGVITHLNIANNPYFANIIDVQDTTHQHILLKTAAFISARFPLVTPPATIRQATKPSQDWSSFVDGGYVDNSALETTMAVLSSILPTSSLGKELCPPLDTDYQKLLKHVEFRVIFIKNSAPNEEGNVPQTLTGFYELTGPAKAFFNSWDNNLSSKYFIAREYLAGKAADSFSTHVDRELHILELDRKNGTIPLGWALSPGANNRINDQVRKLKQLTDGNPNNRTLFTGLTSKFAPK